MISLIRRNMMSCSSARVTLFRKGAFLDMLLLRPCRAGQKLVRAANMVPGLSGWRRGQEPEGCADSSWEKLGFGWKAAGDCKPDSVDHAEAWNDDHSSKRPIPGTVPACAGRRGPRLVLYLVLHRKGFTWPP